MNKAAASQDSSKALECHFPTTGEVKQTLPLLSKKKKTAMNSTYAKGQYLQWKMAFQCVLEPAVAEKLLQSRPGKHKAGGSELPLPVPAAASSL